MTVVRKMLSSVFLILLALAILSNAAVNRQKRSVFGCSNAGIKDSDRKKFLDYHNNARLRVAQGIEPNINGGVMNAAKNMYKLQWDCSMEEKAQEIITECPSGLTSLSDMGQNIIRWSSMGGIIEPQALINYTLDSWWNVGKTYGVRSENKYDDGYLYSFANMVYSKTTKIGCAYKVCGNDLTMTCLYNAIAYYTNQPMWETGTACTKADECTTYASSVCDGGLCSLGGSTTDTTVAPEITTTSAVTAPPETVTTCADNSMTDAARKAFLDEHNRLRSRVALGLEDDPVSGKAPKASRMLKMVYDCDVEASAIKHAKKCVFAHSASGERAGLGENLFMTSVRNFDKAKAGVQASQAWWSELKKYGVGEENRLTMNVFNRGVGHYTQMAWERSYKLGCAVQHCSRMTLVVCQYGPAGNMINGMIYTKGEPCADCTTTCSKDEGLCIVA